MQAVLSQLASLADRYRRASRPFVILAILLPWLLFAGFAVYDYRSEQARARAQIVATADALAEHAKAVVETAELVLARVLDKIHDHDWATIGDDAEVHDFLASLKRELPQLEFGVPGRSGRVQCCQQPVLSTVADQQHKPGILPGCPPRQ